MMTSFRLAIKRHYPANHALQIKSYYGTLSESNGRSFRIRHEISQEAPSGGEITMTSYPACTKTSLYPKPSIADNYYNGTLSGNHGRSFRIRQENSRGAPPGREITMTSYPACNKTSLSQKSCIPDKKLVRNALWKSWTLF